MTHSTDQNRAPVCVVTGGASGIGLATAKRFARAGYQVVVCGRDESKLRTAKTEIDQVACDSGFNCQTMSRKVDLTDTEQSKVFVANVLDRFGQVEVLVNNAALAPRTAFESISEESFESTVNINIRSVFFLTQAIWTAMKTRVDSSVGATIVNVSSLAAIDPFPEFSIYGASKAWVELLTRALATEGKDFGIRICSVRPGAVETPLLRRLFPDFPAEQCVSPEKVADIIWACVANPEDYPSGQAFTITRQSEH